jgi:DNA-binding transcriptional LysR family regulator
MRGSRRFGITSYALRMTRQPDLSDLSLLVLVAETGSIGQAAARLDLSQPTVSRRMVALERSLRVQILSRSRRGTTLTPAGRVVVDWASSLLAAADDFTRSVQTLRERTDSAVSAAVSMTLAEHHAPRWLGQLRRRDPELTVSMTVANSTGVADAVEDGTAEIGFIESPTVRRGLRRCRLGTDKLAVAVAPGHPWARLDAVSAADLSGAALLVREPGSGTRETVEHALRRKHLPMTTGLEVASNTALKSAALAGIGPVAVSKLAVADELADGRLVQIAVPELELNRPLTAVWRREHELSRGAARLLTVARGR